MTTVLLVVAVLVAVLLLFVLIELRKGGGSGRKDDPNAVSAVITSMSERLTAIQEGVGAMKVLAEDFRGFEALIRDVKSRGTWGEVQLRQILEEVLAHGQWEENVETIPGKGTRVEFAIRFPGMNDQEMVWLQWTRSSPWRIINACWTRRKPGMPTRPRKLERHSRRRSSGRQRTSGRST